MAETELWLVELDKAAAALEALEATTPRLSSDIRRRLEAMRDDTARRERRLSHIALRILLEAALGPAVRGQPFSLSPSGKPSLPGNDLSFSLAHTKGLAAIAVGRSGPIGVDIERLRPVRVPQARRGPIEAEAMILASGEPLSAADPDARFLTAWVRLEAAAKAHGSGVGPLLERLRPGVVAKSNPYVAGPHLVVRDVPIQAGVFAAVAFVPEVSMPALRLLPETAQAIVALLEASNVSR
ncbi:4'-phosphopantetheinyl transferase family protein [Hyphomicrobium sp.]|uniref:4'-phosphopantetheinyl transferase family protein n=1 Tax=Hyphomicrobium sp. TaxID=82 RepID=UPI002E31B87E|nr:4'-phosphopantetheinyl transferase superfamily protein [Hyphomicrobium sp.]HEX2839915.1 4'-phosphopantetheinyl transferase superfamily protein [Hyphomicrobium sp.]